MMTSAIADSCHVATGIRATFIQTGSIGHGPVPQVSSSGAGEPLARDGSSFPAVKRLLTRNGAWRKVRPLPSMGGPFGHFFAVCAPYAPAANLLGKEVPAST